MQSILCYTQNVSFIQSLMNMRGKECVGSLVFSDGRKSSASIQTWANKSTSWLRARGILTLEFQNFPQKHVGKWNVGIFYCTKHSNNVNDHIYYLTAVDFGSIEKSETDSEEKIKINVAATRLSDENYTNEKPKIQYDN